MFSQNVLICTLFFKSNVTPAARVAFGFKSRLVYLGSTSLISLMVVAPLTEPQKRRSDRGVS